MQVSSVAGLLALLTGPTTKAGASTAANSFASLLDGGATLGQSNATLGSDDGDESARADPVQAFLNYMKETPAQRLEDAWLSSHHLTRKDLEAMSPEKRQAIEKEMAAEMKDQLKKATEDKAGAQLNILA